MSEVLITPKTMSRPIVYRPSQSESRLFRWFSKIAPHNQIASDNPARSHDLRNSSSLRHLYRQSLRWTLLPVLFILVFYGVLVATILIEGKPQPYYLPHLYHTIEGWLPWLALIATFAGFIIMDFVGMMHTLDSTKADLDKSNWDLIAVSDVEITRYLRGKYASAQIRPWKYMCLMLGVRIATIIVLITHALLRLFMLKTPQQIWDNLFAYPLNIPAVIFLAILSIVMIVLYVIEPIWRLRILVASGIIGVARKPHHTMRVMFAGAQLFNVWMRHLGLWLFIIGLPIMAFIPASNSMIIIKAEHLPFAYAMLLGLSMSLALWLFQRIYRQATDNLLTGGARLLVLRGGAIELPLVRTRRAFIIGLLIPLVIWTYWIFWIWFENQLTIPLSNQLPLYFRPDNLYSLFILLMEIFSIGMIVISLFSWAFISLLASTQIQQPSIEPLAQKIARISVRNGFPFYLSARIVILLIVSLHLMLKNGIPHLANTPLEFTLGLGLLIIFVVYLFKEPQWRANVYHAILKPTEYRKPHWSLVFIGGLVFVIITLIIEGLITHTALRWFGKVAWEIMLNPSVQITDYGIELLRLAILLVGVISIYKLIIAFFRQITRNESLRLGNDLVFNKVNYSDDDESYQEYS